jgi:hypothetical protein
MNQPVALLTILQARTLCARKSPNFALPRPPSAATTLGLAVLRA